MTEQQWIVQVGTDKETANPEHADEAGFDFWGPFTGEQAQSFAAAVRGQFEDLAKEDPHGFVFGQVSVVLLPLRYRPMPLHNAAAQGENTALVANAVAAASNWHLSKDQREA